MQKPSLPKHHSVHENKSNFNLVQLDMTKILWCKGNIKIGHEISFHLIIMVTLKSVKIAQKWTNVI